MKSKTTLDLSRLAVITTGKNMYYAIGDVHGHYDLLCDLYSKIHAHHEQQFGNADYMTVLLGDLIDRGPDSKKVLEFAAHSDPDKHVVLPGNHELMCANAVRSFKSEGSRSFAVEMWLSNGGDETLSSYCDQAQIGIEISIDEAFGIFLDHHASFIDQLAYQKHPYFLDRNCHLLFVHAGVLMDRKLKHHAREELLWTRNRAFLESNRKEWIEPNLLVVHGHTPSLEPTVRHRRIGIDTGAYFTGVLTACGLQNAFSEPVFIQTNGAA